MKRAPLPGRKIPSWKSTSQCQFNFTLGAIKPFSNHLVLLAASAVNSGDVIYSLDIAGGGGEIRSEPTRSSPLFPTEASGDRLCPAGDAGPGSGHPSIHRVTSSPPTQAGRATDGPVWGGKTEAGQLSPQQAQPPSSP